MSSIVEQLVLMLVKQLLTPDLIKQGEVMLVGWLAALAKQSATTVDDAVVKAIADALGVPVPA